MVTRCAARPTRAWIGVLSVLMAVCGAVAVAAAPGAAAAPTPSACPAGYLAASANGTFVGAPVPGRVEEGPKGGGMPGRPNDGSTTATRFGELVGTGCFRHSGGTAGMRLHWSSIGRIASGMFVYQLFDCTTGTTSQALTRHLGYEAGAGTSGGAEATLTVDPSHTYRMRITGEGSYERSSDGFSGVLGYWSVSPPDGNPAWTASTVCA
ncbi:MAG: hypothetical protein QOK35_982 [Pseudonocardiales bacterium]|nr:hypothetical protein [Pseudonocardiales bacterium]